MKNKTISLEVSQKDWNLIVKLAENVIRKSCEESGLAVFISADGSIPCPKDAIVTPSGKK